MALATTPETAPLQVGLSKDIIYFVMPDRYLNGDPSNDLAGGTTTDPTGGYNPTSTAFFHGGDLKGLTGKCSSGDNGLARIKALGFTAVWLTPLVVQVLAHASGAGYHGYWGADFLNVDPHLGTKSDLTDLSACAKKLGLKLILDIVTNHTGDVIQYQDKVAFIPAGKENAKNPAWLNDLSNYHNVGTIDHCWGDGPCMQLGDFYTLDDLATEKPVVYQGWVDVYSQWIKDYGLSGFRVDTARHVDNEFFKNWSPGIQAAAKSVGINNFTIFGEVYDINPVDLMGYVRVNKIQTVLDFPFQHVAAEFASGNSDAAVMQNLFLKDDMYTSPTSTANNLVTFLGNHDMGRIGFLISDLKDQTKAELLPRTELAHALLYLTRGIPTVYYGDEVGMTGTGPGLDQMARQDMFPTQIAAWKTEARIGSLPVGNGNSFSQGLTNPISKYIQLLAGLRKKYPGLSNGQMQVRYASGSVLVVSKRDPVENKEYLVAFNNGKKAAKIKIATASTSGWNLLMGKSTFSNAAAAVTLTVPALDTVVLQAKKTVDVTAVKLGKLVIQSDDLTGYDLATANMTTSNLVSVEFKVQTLPNGPITSAGVDNNAPYSVYLDPNDYPGVTSISVTAIATNTKGEHFAYKASTFSLDG